MALIVEDGTGLATAESYISVADADTYIASYKGADATWDGATEAEKEVAARRAAQYLDGLYSWRGRRLEITQALGMPTTGGFDHDDMAIEGVPQRLKHATAEAMFLIIAGTAVTENVERGGQTKREKVGEIEIEYLDWASNQPQFPVISRLVYGLANSSGRIERS